MSENIEQDNLILRALLSRTDSAPADDTSSEHMDDEMLALFAEGALRDADRASVVQHLADCVDCRKAASLLLADEVQQQTFTEPQTLRNASRFSRKVMWAVAAMMLVAFGLLSIQLRGRRDFAERRTYYEASQLLASADFDQAGQVLRAASAGGVQSDRLLSLESQAMRRLRGTLALSAAGRLSDFGYDIGGVVARGPVDPSEQSSLALAAEVLSKAGTQDREVLLNRGHVLLSQGDYAGAAEQFQTRLRVYPNDAWAWMGRGLALFLRDDFGGAEEAFRHCLELDKTLLAARINLGMTLEEQGLWAQAVKEWDTLLKLELSASDRHKISVAKEQCLRELQSFSEQE